MAGQLNVMYGNLCVQTPAESLPITELEKQVAEFNRAKYHYLRGRQYILENLDRALAERWIKVYYQPIIRNANGQVSDEEALARWIDPDRGLLPPSEFISVLEDSGLIYKLDLYMIDRVLEELQRKR